MRMFWDSKCPLKIATMLRSISRNIISSSTRNIFQLCEKRNLSQRPVFSETVDTPKYSLLDNDIAEAILANPKLEDVKNEFWNRAHQTFSSHGFPTNNFLRMIIGNPAILCHPPHKISHNLEKWRACQFGEKNLHIFLTKYPEMLDIDDTKNMHTQITFLREVLLNQANVWKMLMNVPELMMQPQTSIREKIDYLTQKMGLGMPEIVKSAALAKSLEEIKVRHVFQVRLGLFKRPKKDADPLEPSTNCRLYKITDTSDKTFATKICHASLDEFYAFRELYLREQETTTGDSDSEDEL